MTQLFHDIQMRLFIFTISRIPIALECQIQDPGSDSILATLVISPLPVISPVFILTGDGQRLFIERHIRNPMSWCRF